MGASDDRAASRLVTGLAKWWRSTSQAQRLEALKASIRGDENAPSLKTLHLAIILAEIEEAACAEEGQRGSQAIHGAPAGDA